MWHFFTHLLDTEGFVARGQCGGGWEPELRALHQFSEAAIACAYLAIPALLLISWLRHPTPRPPFSWLVFCFAAFIGSCGLTHAMSVVTFWYPVYRLSGLINGITALLSWGTALLMVPAIPVLLQSVRGRTFDGGSSGEGQTH